jgi:hypothetical protein
LFDIDFPGHYCRRIVSVSLSIPCIVGPYTSLNCTLRLLQHTYRISSASDSAASYPEDASGDSRFRTDNIPITSVAIGSPAPGYDYGTGTFSFGFPGDSYSPFEGAGAISTWQIDLPPELRQFDYRTISDVVLHVDYTALDGGAAFSAAASQVVLDAIKPQPGCPGALALLVNVPGDYASEWYTLRAAIQGGSDAQMVLANVASLLPFWTESLKVTVNSISVVVFPDPGGQIDVTKLAVAEYPGIEWVPGQTRIGDALVLDASIGNKSMAQNWSVSLPGSGNTGVAIDAMWFLVLYSAQPRS